MATLRKYVTTTDINVYEVELTDEQLETYQEDLDRFYDEIMEDLEFEWVHDKTGDEDWESMEDIHEEVVDICLENDELFDLSEDDDGDIFEQYSNLIWELLIEQ